MSTPIFVRSVALSHASVVGDGSEATIIAAGDVAEQRLVEEVRFAAANVTGAGVCTVRAKPPGGSSAPIAIAAIPAGSGSQPASGTIALSLAVPAGWEISFSHNLGGSFVLHAWATGGILR